MHEIKTFGGVEVRSPAGEIKSFRSRKHVGLLIYLRSSPRRVHLRERLVDLFWKSEPSLARHSLSQALYDIRTTLGQVVSNCPGDALQIEADRLAFDVEELERAVKRGELPKAVDLYTGPFAPDLDRAGTEEFEHWLEGERARLSVLGQTALRQFLEYADNRGEWGEMCSGALRLIRMNPLDEAAHRALMRGLWLHGDQTSALEHFGEVRERLDDELPDGVSRETLELVRRIEGSRPPGFQGAASAERVPPLVGRESELEALAEFADLPDDVAETLLITGEAGIGKTRLIGELRKLLTLQGHSILQSQCYAAEAEVAYGPVLDGLRDVTRNLSDLAGSAQYRELGRLFPAVRQDDEEEAVRIPADGQSARRRLFEEIADVLRRYAQERSVVWIIEDIHCIDGASSALLHYLARRLASEPFRLVLTTRTESEQNEAARTLLTDDHFIENSRELTVPPLGREAVEKLVEAVKGEEMVDPPIVDRITNLSGGNPFYAVELARSWGAQGDSGFRENIYTGKLKSIMNRCLKGLDATAVRVLNALCVVYPHTSPKVVQEVLSIDVDQLSEATEELVRRNVIQVIDDEFVFVHDVLREFVYQELGLVNRSALHLSAGEVLAGERDVSSSTVAHHFGAGGDSLRAYEYALRAARKASQRSGWEEASAIAEFGAEHAPSATAKINILKLLATSQINSGEYRSAITTYSQLLGLAEEIADRKEWVRLSLSLAEAYVEVSEWQDALGVLSSLQDKVDWDARSPEWLKERVEHLRLQISVAIWGGNHEGALQEAAQLKRYLQESSPNIPVETKLRAVYALGIYQTFCGSLLAAQKAIANAEPLLERSTDLEIIQKLMILRSGVEEKSGNWDVAEYWLNRALSTMQEKRDVLAEAKTYNNFACLALGKGDWRRAKSYLNKTIGLCSTLPGSAALLITAKLNHAKAAFYEGNHQQAFKRYVQLENMLENNEHKLLYFEPEIRGGLALSALCNGEVELALDQRKQLSHLVNTRELSTIQESFIVYWLDAFIEHWRGQDGVYESLTGAIKRVEQTDKVAALKLKWIRQALVIDGSEARGCKESTSLLEQMKSYNLYWFVRFFNRWCDLAQSKIRGSETLRAIAP
jgi:DNA-binding SARP family transcriptional activator/tetratricopeptide (TPR) repeat protein